MPSLLLIKSQRRGAQRPLQPLFQIVKDVEVRFVSILSHLSHNTFALSASYPLGRKCFDLLIQSRLVTCRLILVHDALGDHHVDHRHCFAQCGTGARSVVRFDRRIHTLNVRADHRALAGVLNASFFRLASAFTCLGTISQGFLRIGGQN